MGHHLPRLELGPQPKNKKHKHLFCLGSGKQWDPKKEKNKKQRRGELILEKVSGKQGDPKKAKSKKNGELVLGKLQELLVANGAGAVVIHVGDHLLNLLLLRLETSREPFPSEREEGPMSPTKRRAGDIGF